MKFRVLSLLFLAFAGVISLGSCTKSYTCHCDITYSGYPGLPNASSKEYTIIDTKTGAKSKCMAESGKYNNDNISSVETCYLY